LPREALVDATAKTAQIRFTRSSLDVEEDVAILEAAIRDT
jgi:hypothetical protein